MEIRFLAIVASSWPWNSSSLSINKSESLIEVWAVLKTSNVGSDILLGLLDQLIVGLAVVSDLWVWHTSGLSVIESHSLVKVWAVRKAID